jgi:hypothetical protein
MLRQAQHDSFRGRPCHAEPRSCPPEPRSCRRADENRDRLPRHPEPAAHRLPDARGSAASASRTGSRGGASTASTSAGSRATRATRRGSCTTGRRTRTATCTWGTFLNRVLKDVFVKVHLLDGKVARSSCRAGTCTACRSSSRRSSTSARFPPDRSDRTAREVPRTRAALARRAARRSCAWACSATTIIPIARSIRSSKRRSSRRSRRSRKRSNSTRACVRRSGASATRRRSPKPRSNTRTQSRRRSTCALRRPTRSAPICSRARVYRRTRPATLPLSILIWTTTPWTLPANVAIALKADAAIRHLPSRRRTAVARRRAGAPSSRAWTAPSRSGIGGALGTALVGAAVRHPFLDRDSLVVGAEYVELDSGTGAVHTAPGHGADDFETGMRFGLPILNPVDGSGHLHERGGTYAGLPSSRPTSRSSPTSRERRALRARRLRPLVPALLALQEPGDLPRDLAVVHRDGRQQACASGSRRRSRAWRGSPRGANTACCR